MRIAVCDICYHLEHSNKLTTALYTSHYKSKDGVSKISVHTCEEHKSPFKGCTSIEEARARYDHLVETGKIKEGK